MIDHTVKPCPNLECEMKRVEFCYSPPGCRIACRCGVSGPTEITEAKAKRLWNLMAGSRWISVKDVKPKKNVWYLVVNAGGHQTTARLDAQSIKWWEAVTHYQPLPQSPETA